MPGRPLRRRARLALLLVALCVLGAFAVAWLLPAEDEAGRPRRMGTHELLGLPPCVFHELTGLACPSCGLTTSFCHFVRGDLANSLKANAAGTLLALACLMAIPWCLHGAGTGRVWGLRRLSDLDLAFLVGIGVLFGLLLGNWCVRLAVSFLVG